MLGVCCAEKLVSEMTKSKENEVEAAAAEKSDTHNKRNSTTKKAQGEQESNAIKSACKLTLKEVF